MSSTAFSRTALTPGGEKIGRKFAGLIGGCAIVLSPPEDITYGLTIGEGIETTASAMERYALQPAWAMGTRVNIASLPMLAGVDCLRILVDTDAKGHGRQDAETCRDRWLDAYREVRLITSPVGKDMIDLANFARAS
jgi:Toprim domain